MKKKLTHDELAVLAIYWADEPGDTIKKIVDIIPYVDDADMASIVQSTIKKVEKMENEEYKQIKENLKYIGSEINE